MKSRIIYMLVILTIMGTNTDAQVGLDKLGQSTMNFLAVSVSPKASGMGDAYFGMCSGVESIFYNPAGLAKNKNEIEAVFNYTQWIADINYLAGAVSWRIENIGTVGISLLSVDYGTIYGTSLINPSQSAQYPLGYIDNGELSGVGAYYFGISYAKAITEQFSIGGNIRLAGQNLGTNNFNDGTSRENNATKLVFDAGVQYNTGFKDFRFGMAIRNFSSNIKREEIDEQLPLVFTVGTAIDLVQFISPENSKDNELTLAVDYIHSNNFSERFNVGMEYKLLDMIYLRGGYQSNRDLASWSGGIGFSKAIGSYLVDINYSISQMEIFDNVNRLSVGFGF